MATSRIIVPLLATLAITGCATMASSAQAQRPPVLLDPQGHGARFDELYRGHDATVIVFWSGGCPCVRRYQERVDGLLDHYPADRVRIVGIASNDGESLADVQRVVRERKVRIPVYRDEAGSVARLLGARSTPTTVLLDAAGKVRFIGWFDNERRPGQADREPWLENALDGLLAGREDFSARAPTYGCPITRSIFGPSKCSGCSNHVTE